MSDYVSIEVVIVVEEEVGPLLVVQDELAVDS